MAQGWPCVHMAQGFFVIFPQICKKNAFRQVFIISRCHLHLADFLTKKLQAVKDWAKTGWLFSVQHIFPPLHEVPEFFLAWLVWNHPAFLVMSPSMGWLSPEEEGGRRKKEENPEAPCLPLFATHLHFELLQQPLSLSNTRPRRLHGQLTLGLPPSGPATNL